MRYKKKIVDWSIYLLLKGVIVFFSFLPYKAVQSLSNCFAYLLKFVFSYRKKIIKDNLEKSFLRRSAMEIDQIASDYYQHLSDLLFETIEGYTISKAALRKHIHYTNPEIFRPYLEKGQSCLLVGSHYNNWELACLSFPLWIKASVYTVYKPLSNKYIDSYLCKLRSKWGMNMVPMRQLGRRLIEQKEQASLFVFVADQSPASLDHAIWINFLNRNTPFIHGFEKVAQKTNYPVFYFSIKKVKRGFYKIDFHEIAARPDQLEYGVLTKLYAQCLENEIRQEPANWLWSHRRWKRVEDQTG